MKRKLYLGGLVLGTVLLLAACQKNKEAKIANGKSDTQESTTQSTSVTEVDPDLVTMTFVKADDQRVTIAYHNPASYPQRLILSDYDHDQWVDEAWKPLSDVRAAIYIIQDLEPNETYESDIPNEETGRFKYTMHFERGDLEKYTVSVDYTK